MRTTALIVLAALFSAVPAGAQLTTYYKGVQRDGDKEVPATAQYSVEKGRVAMIMKGSQASRMLFLEKEQVLRIVNDDEKNYIDLDKSTMQNPAADPAAMLADAQKQLAQLPPEQRQMAEQMMHKALGTVKQPPPSEYVWSKETRTISGYECTRVDVMRGGVKKAEYWGTTSADFKLSDAEHKTMLAMQGYLRNFLIMVHAAQDGGGVRAFQWDTSVDGYPVITRCFDGDKMTLDLHLESVNRSPFAKDLFSVPSSYKKMDMTGRAGH